MVQRRHFENAFLARLVRAHLQDHRKRLNHEDTADEWQQQLLLDDDGDRADGSAQRQRADIAHKYLRWMRVIPEKSDAGTNHGTTKDGELSHLRYVGQVKISGEDCMSTHISEHGECAGGDDGAADGEAVKAVSEIHRVARADDHQRDETDKWDEREEPGVLAAKQRIDDQVRTEIL